MTKSKKPDDTPQNDQPRITLVAPERSATIGEHGRRKWVYSDIVHGRFLKARDTLGVFLIVLYLAIPFIKIGDSPLLRFDMPARRYSILGKTFVNSDLFLLALLLVILLLGLFLFSALLGRLWCGWACPQTVYLEGVYRRIERWIEGVPFQRRKLDSGAKGKVYYGKKIVKHGLYFLISNVLSLCFAGYFVGPEGVHTMVFHPASHPEAAIVVWVMTVATYLNFAWFREQMCTFICPYARLQSVMLDEHSLIIGYDPLRGEPRMPIRPGVTGGDCIDCKRCVQVCPAGIDIRDGLQLECINCVACIDACDMVMDRVNRPRGLIRYDSLAGLQRQTKKILRPRVILYGVVMIILITIFTVRLSGRELLAMSVVRPPGVPYLEQDDGKIRNRYTIHVTNADARAHTTTIELDGKPEMELIVPGQPFELQPGERITIEAFVLWPEKRIKTTSTPLKLILYANGKQQSAASAMFLGKVDHDHEDHDDHNDHHE